MPHTIQTNILINASKEKVWNILTDFPAYQKWNSFIVDIQGEFKVGSRLKNTMVNGKRTFVFKPKILKIEPLQYFDWLGVLFINGIFNGQHFFRLEEVGPGQVMLYQGENFSGILAGFLLKKIGDDTRDNFIKMNEAVKGIAEQS